MFSSIAYFAQSDAHELAMSEACKDFSLWQMFGRRLKTDCLNYRPDLVAELVLTIIVASVIIIFVIKSINKKG